MSLFMGRNIPEGIDSNNTHGPFTFGYAESTIDYMSEFTNEQLLLKHLRDTHCAGVDAKLAREIGKDASYVNRLFYPVGKKGRKGIGLDIMRACTEKFQLPSGFWEMSIDDIKGANGTHMAAEITPVSYFNPGVKLDPICAEAVQIIQALPTIEQKKGALASLKTYVSFLGPPRDGQALQVAGG